MKETKIEAVVSRISEVYKELVTLQRKLENLQDKLLEIAVEITESAD